MTCDQISNVLLLDEIYEHINYVGKHESISQFPEIRDRVIIVNGVSKGYAMTGWRLGWIAAPNGLPKLVAHYRDKYIGPSSISQKAALAALIR
jgi:aspartate aminotransferase